MFDTILNTNIIIKLRLASKMSIPSVPLFFQSFEKAAWERNHP